MPSGGQRKTKPRSWPFLGLLRLKIELRSLLRWIPGSVPLGYTSLHGPGKGRLD